MPEIGDDLTPMATHLIEGLAGADAYTLAIRRLRPYLDLAENDADLDVSADLKAEVSLSALKIKARVPALPAYSVMTGTDQTWFDVAVGMLTVITLANQMASLASDGLSRLKTPDGLDVSFRTPGMDEQVAWAAEMRDALERISFVATQTRVIGKDVSLMRVGGLRRSQQSRGFYDLSYIVTTLLPAEWGVITSPF